MNGAMRDLIGFMHSRVHGQALPGAPRHRSRLGECPGADERRRAAPAACGGARGFAADLRGKENEDDARGSDRIPEDTRRASIAPRAARLKSGGWVGKRVAMGAGREPVAAAASAAIGVR